MCHFSFQQFFDGCVGNVFPLKQNLTFGVVSVVAGALLPITSKFATQVLVFFGLILSIAWQPMYAAILLGAFLCSLIISRGHLLVVLRGQLRHSSFYGRRLMRM